MGLRLPAASASGQTRWEEQLPLPEAQWGQERGQGGGQWPSTTFPRCWEPRLDRADPQPMGFVKEAVPFIFIKHSLNRLYFSYHFNFRNGLTFAIAEN